MTRIRLLALSLLLLATVLPTAAAPYNTITVDGLWGAGEWDQANETAASNTFSGWGDFGNVQSILVTWDASNLYVGLRGNAWNNAMLIYIDSSSITTSQENADWFQGYDTQSFFDPDFVGGCFNMEYGSGGTVPTDIRAISAADGSTTSLLGTASIAVHDKNGDGGLGEGLTEIAIPWSVIGLQPNGSVSVAAGVGWAVNQDPVIPAGGLGGFSGDELGGADQQGGTDGLDNTLDGAVTVVYDGDGDGLPDELSDTLAPSLLSACTLDGNESLVAATFDEPVTQASAENLANWSIDGGLTILSATLQADPAVVYLQLNALAGFGTSYTVAASNITDLSGNTSGTTDTGFCLVELTLIAHMEFKFESSGADAVSVEGGAPPLTWDPLCDDPLVDDGTNGDAAAGDSLFTTQLVFCLSHASGEAPAPLDVEYKLNYGCAEYENLSNRSYTVDCPIGQDTVEIWWNDENPEDFTTAPVDVVFSVDMSDSLGPRTLVGINGGQGNGTGVAPLNWNVPSENALSDADYPGGVADDGVYGTILRFPEGSFRDIAYKYLFNDEYECADQGNRGVYLNEAAFDTLGGAMGPLVLPTGRYQRCTVTARAVEVIFAVDMSYLYDGPAAGDTIAVNGSVPPLAWNVPSDTELVDDGVAPDDTAGDEIFTASVVFPDSSQRGVNYKYLWNTGYECGDQGDRFFWIDDLNFDSPRGPQVLAVDIWGVCNSVGADETPLSAGVALRGSYPNPFNPKTTVAFSLAEPGRVRLEIFDLSGRLVRTLIDGQAAAGEHLATWSGLDAGGQPVPSGIYFAKVSAHGRTESSKLTLLK